jgi:large subunit ribosomal protein L4
MITLPVLNIEGQQVSSVEIDPAEFGGTVNKQLLHDVVVMHRANARVGTHRTKTRGDVAGSGKKLFRQKGTGHARAGSRRTGKRRGGGTAHGPKPRDYSYAMPKRARRLATRMALLSKFQDSEAVVVQDLFLAEPRTKTMAGILKAIGLAGETCLIGTNGIEPNVYLSGRNLAGVDIMAASDLNTYAVLRRRRLLLTLDALQSLRSVSAASPTPEDVQS